MSNTLQLFSNDTVISVNDFYSLTRTEMLHTVAETSEHAYYQGRHNGICIGLYYGTALTLLFVASIWAIKKTLGKRLNK